jgi:hypothetical protein
MKLAMAVLSALTCLATGCSGKPHTNSGDTSTPPPVTISVPQALAALQAQGKLPILDVSSSVAGTDADRNGIRDDIDKFVAGLPDSPAEKKALLQFAGTLQSSMTIDPADNNAVATVLLNSRRAIHCIWSVYPTGQHNKVLLIEEISANTLTRLIAYENYNKKISGTVISSVSGSTCD